MGLFWKGKPNFHKINLDIWISGPILLMEKHCLIAKYIQYIIFIRSFKSGLEKLTNANRSVSSVNDRLFQVELTEIADLKSMSEYMLHLNFGKALTGVFGGNFGAYTFILPLPCLLNICLSFWMFYRRKIYLNIIKILRNFRE